MTDTESKFDELVSVIKNEFPGFNEYVNTGEDFYSIICSAYGITEELEQTRTQIGIYLGKKLDTEANLIAIRFIDKLIRYMREHRQYYELWLL
jgi:hypothetical protein